MNTIHGIISIVGRELIIEIEVIGTKVTLNKSSVQFIPDSNTSDADDSNKNVVQKTLIRIVGKDGASTNETDKLLKTVQLKIRFDDPTTMVVEYESITDKAAAAEGISETGYVDDEEDSFRCGVCLEEFFVLEAFKLHKKSPCRKDNTGSLPELTISEDYLIVEYNMNAFSRFDELQKRITLLLKDSGLQELSKDLLKYPVASLYKGDGYSNLHYTYFKSKKYLKTIDANALQDNADTYGVMLCFLEADFGHLTNMDKKCLHKIRQELPVYLINKTLCGLIKDFKFEDNILKINVGGDLKNNEMVNDFVKTYFRRDVRTTIIFSKSHTLTLPKKANNQ
ncbi:unnamed protein product [Mytilus edulis]|uniref:Uncharacterized protein n=1 Tax=Mytilus edulis TaxID=6550 RepID=A0A8S3TCU4_MYTED|nr:unnamed protein product [Mytilus edulis]